jgi:hypothetical protein
MRKGRKIPFPYRRTFAKPGIVQTCPADVAELVDAQR